MKMQREGIGIINQKLAESLYHFTDYEFTRLIANSEGRPSSTSGLKAAMKTNFTCAARANLRLGAFTPYSMDVENMRNSTIRRN